MHPALWGRFGTDLGSIGGRFGVDWGSISDRFCDFLRLHSHTYLFGTVFGSIWERFGTLMGSRMVIWNFTWDYLLMWDPGFCVLSSSDAADSFDGKRPLRAMDVSCISGGPFL